ncbi:hypothetical protein H5410_059065 [Solanum commersonii]|uniref:Reverse transcriptase zinc-binding domain-containing protein n=1 Tax=Solanum commersonii TaxID=4109 RepID=A0A9J5W1C1_SOLCO|nr:hypothetical protein H5410_059065 [Solanum commersonii]
MIPIFEESMVISTSQSTVPPLVTYHRRLHLASCPDDSRLVLDPVHTINLFSPSELITPWKRDNNDWSSLFRKNLHDCKLNDLFSLLATLADSMSDELHSDKMVWGNSKQGHDTVKGNYYLMCSQNGLLHNSPWKHVGKITLPLKLACFIWLALTGAFLTQDNLSKKDSPSLPTSIKEAYSSWIFWKVDKAIKRIGRMIAVVIVSVWDERNQKCFDGVSALNNSLKASCLVNLFSGTILSPLNNVHTFLDFVRSLILSIGVKTLYGSQLSSSLLLIAST